MSWTTLHRIKQSLLVFLINLHILSEAKAEQIDQQDNDKRKTQLLKAKATQKIRRMK